MFTLPLTDFDCGRTCKQDHWCRFSQLFKLAGITTRIHSHVAKIATIIGDLDALAFACQQCGVVLNRNQKTYRWYGSSVGDFPLPEGMTVADLGKCAHAISVPGDRNAYEIGVIQRQDGKGYDLVWDFWAGGYGMQALVGDGCGKLLEAYHYAAIEQAALNLGWLSEKTEGGLTVYHPQGGALTVSRDGTVETSGFVGNGCHEMREQLGVRVEEGSILAKPELASAVASVSLPL